MRGRLLVLVVAAAAAVLALPGAGMGHAAVEEGDVQSCVEFRPAGHSDAKGHAELVTYPSGSELSWIRMKRLEPRAIHLFWFQAPSGSRYWAGAGMKTDRQGLYRGASEVLGSEPVARRHTKRARSIVVTVNTRASVRRVGRKFKPSEWKRRGKVIGNVVAGGALHPPSNGYCVWP